MNGAAPPHRTRFAVRYHETDQMGVVHHAVYLHWFELGRTEMMAEAGMPYAELERAGTLLTVVESRLRHHGPARYGEDVVVETSLAEVGRVRVRFEYRVLGGPACDRLLATGGTELASVDRSLRPRRLSEDTRRRLAAIGRRPGAAPAG